MTMQSTGSATNVYFAVPSVDTRNPGNRKSCTSLKALRRKGTCPRSIARFGAALALIGFCGIAAQTQTPVQNWNLQSPANSPGERYIHSMAYDATHSQVVLFGGFGPGGDQNDTWLWNGTNWTNATPADPANSPSPRSASPIAYDPSQGNVVLFGGLYGASTRYGDTWVWNGTIWSNVTPANPVNSPSARASAVLAYDAAQGNMVMFGGVDANGLTIGDTWTWNGTTRIWTNATPSSSANSPSARADYSMAYDAAHGQVVLFGGRDLNGNYVNDTWVWDGANWTNVTPVSSSAGPAARYAQGMAYDAALGEVVMWGGENGSGNLNDMWAWNGSTWTQLTPLTNPSARVIPNGFVYDSAQNQIVMFGGYGATQLDDTWTWGIPENFGLVNVCPSGQTTPAPCSETVPFTFSVPGTTFGTTQVLTQGQTGFDFTLAGGNTCVGTVASGNTCTVNVTFTPLAPGLRTGALELYDNTGLLLSTVPIYGAGQGAAAAFSPGTQTTVKTGSFNLSSPKGVAVDAAGDVFIADNGNTRVVEVPANGTPITVGVGLLYPQGLAVDGAGDLFIADNNLNETVEVPPGCNNQNCQIILPTPQCQVGVSGFCAQLGVAVDGAGNAYVASFNGEVLEVPANGGAQTVAYNPPGANPIGLAVDSAGDLFVADYGLQEVVKIPAGCTSSSCWIQVGTGWFRPEAVAVDAAGDVFVADESPKVVEVPAGCIQNAACQITISNVLAYGVAVDAKGNVYLPEEQGTQVIQINHSQPPSLTFAATNVGTSSSDSPQTVSVENIGNQALSFASIVYPTDFPEYLGTGTDCSTSSPLVSGSICTLSINFTPTTGSLTPGTLLSESVGLTDNVLNATNATQSVSVQGVGVETGTSVPNVVGDSQATASAVIVTGTNLIVGTVTTQSSSTVPSGDVISQSPVAGTIVNAGTAVNLVVSSGPAQVSTPSVVGMAQAVASTVIGNGGLALGTVTTQYSDTVPSGNVISQSPTAGTIVNGGTQVNLVVSNGQPPATDQLTLENNYFVTGDYATGGVTLHGTGTGTITIADSTTSPGAPGVPDGADIRVAYLYWTTVENTATPSGMNGTFQGYSITGLQVGADQPNYNDGTYTGTLRVYRADVNSYLPILKNSTNGVRIGSGSFNVSLPNGGASGLPVTEGASLVEIYRVLSKNFPLKSVLLYNGSVLPNSSTGPIPQAMQGFYDAVGGANGTGEVTNLFTAGGTWSNSSSSPTLGQSNEYIDTLNSGNAYAAVILSTPVNNSDGDGILDAWKLGPAIGDPNYGTPGYYDVKTGAFVALPGAVAGEKDLFVQFDYMCSALLADGVTCDFTQPNLYPSPDAQGNDPLALVKQAFLNSGVHLHLKPGNAILESTYTCADSSSVLCEFPSTPSAPQPGVVAWNGGVQLSKIWPANFNACTASPSIANCATRFPLGQKDSYHYVMFSYSLAIPAWNSWFGSLTSITVNNGSTTLVTTGLNGSCPTRVTISGVLGNPSLNGVYATNGCDSGLTTIYLSTPLTVPNWSYPNITLPEPTIGVTSGTVTSISGYSDVGGSDSVISLGLWAQNPNQDMSKPSTVVAGTILHELGHTLGLTHGGLYYDSLQSNGSYIPTYEVNCKPNYQSSMNYLFQLDGVGSTGTVAYSNQSLGDQNHNPLSLATLGSVTSLTDVTGVNAATGSSSWYAPYNPATTTSSPATAHCDGSPLNGPGDQAVRVNGTVDPLSPAWSNSQNVTFDGTPYTTLRGYNDVANLDLRQVGATSNQFASLANLTSYSSSGVTIGGGGGVTIGGGGGVTIGGGGGVTIGGGGGVTIGGGGGVTIGGGGGVTIGGGGGVTIGGGGGVTIGGGGGVTIGGGGGATTEMDYLTANSFVRPPSSPGMTPIPSGVVITWNAPAFGVVQTYTIYRNVNNGGAVAVGSVSGVNGNPPGTTWTDFNPATGTVIYTITTTLLPVPIDPTERQSQPSPPAVMKSAQSIDLSLPGSVSISSSPVTITATAETNGAANGLQVNFVATGSCSVASQSIASGISSASLNLNSTGSCNITASQSGSSTYDAASPVSGSFTILSSGQNTQSQTINLSQLQGVQYGSGFMVSAMSSSGVGVTFAASGPCTVGATVGTATGATTGAGKCTITATAPANGNFGVATAVQSFTVYQAVLKVTAFSPTIPYGQAIPSLTPALNTNYTLTGFIGTDGPSSVNGVPALSTNAVQGSAPASYPITVSTGTLASTNYSFLYVNGNLNIQQASQAITFTQKAPSAAAFNTSFTVTATGGASGNPVTFMPSGPCAITGTASTATSYSATFLINNSTGTCSVIANQAGNTDYSAAPPAIELVNASGPAVTVTPSSINFGTVNLGSINTQTITVSSVGTAPVSISGPILSIVQGGNSNEFVAVNLCPSSLAVGHSCTVTIAFVAGPFYTPQTATLEIMDNAPSNPQPVSLSAQVLQPQTISFSTNPPASATYSSKFAVVASASSGLGVVYTSAGACSNVGATYTMTSGVGTCSVIANQPGNGTYAAAPQVIRAVSANPAAQTISFTTLPPASAPYKSAFPVAATASSGLTVTFASSGACNVLGLTYTMTSGNGTCTVIATQAGNSNYSPAPSITKGVSATLASQTITFSTAPPAVAAYKTSFTVVASGGGSGNAVTFKSSGACTNSGATFTMTAGTGTCSVIANQAGNSNYAAAPQLTVSVGATYSVATLTPTAGLNFGTVAKGKSSTSLPVTLTNAGTTPLIISSLAVTGTNKGNFTATSNCPGATSSLAPTLSCTINVVFNSSGTAASASITVTDNTQAGSQSVSLSGN